MAYYVNYEDPIFPRIQVSDRGITLEEARLELIRHHMLIILDHCSAMERALDEVPHAGSAWDTNE